MRRKPSSARNFRRTGLLLLALALVGYLGQLPTGYLVMLPGEVRDVGGMVAVEGEERPDGFLMTTVSTRRADLPTLLLAAVHPRMEVRHQNEFLRPGQTLEQYYEYNRLLMRESQAFAALAAWRYLGQAVSLCGAGAVVAAVAADGATGTLRPGDVVVGCGATAIGSRGDLLQCVAQAPAGTKLQLRVLRGEAELTLEVTVGTDGALPGLELVTLDPRVEGPVTVSFDAGDVSGPSAGLMFALELIDRLHGSLELLGRGRVAGTGIIDADGRVAPVGGAELKVIAAERAGAAYFLVPAANAAAAARAAKSIRVVPVHSVEHAVEQLLARR